MHTVCCVCLLCVQSWLWIEGRGELGWTLWTHTVCCVCLLCVQSDCGEREDESSDATDRCIPSVVSVYCVCNLTVEKGKTRARMNLVNTYCVLCLSFVSCLLCVGLARTMYMHHHIYIYTYIWFWPTHCVCNLDGGAQVHTHTHTRAPMGRSREYYQRRTTPPKMGMFFKCSPRMGPQIGQYQTRHQHFLCRALLLEAA